MSLQPEELSIAESGNGNASASGNNSMTNDDKDMVITLGLSDSYRRYKYDFHIKDLCHGNLMKKAIGAFSIPSPVMCIFQKDKVFSSAKNCSGKQYFEKFVRYGYDDKQRMYVVYVMHSSLLSTSTLSVFREQDISAGNDAERADNRRISVKSLLQDKITEGWEGFAQDTLECLSDLLGSQPKIHLSESEFKAYSLRLLMTTIKKPGGYSGSKCEIKQCQECRVLADQFSKASLSDNHIGNESAHHQQKENHSERVSREANALLIAHGANCDNCNERIFGCRHKCRSCTDFDLCDRCFGKASSLHPGHAFKSLYGNANGMFDLEHEAICDGCDLGIMGVRYKCLDCPDFDYCESCYGNASKSHRGHRFVPIYNKLKEPVTQKPIHLHVICDGANCRSQGRRCITGVRYKCATCPNYDLCADCEAVSNSFHDPSHAFLKIKVPILSECPAATNVFDDERGMRMRHKKAHQMRDKGKHHFHLGKHHFHQGDHHFHRGNHHSREGKLAHTEESELGRKGHHHHHHHHHERRGRSNSSAGDHASVQEAEKSPKTTIPRRKPAWDSSPTSCNFWNIRKVPNEEFSHYWTMKNIGRLAWPAGTVMRHTSGKDMSMPPQAGFSEFSALKEPVEPGEIVTFVLPMRAPSDPGSYGSEWQMIGPNNWPFGAIVHTTIEVLDDGSVSSLPSTTSIGSSTVVIPEIDFEAVETEESTPAASPTNRESLSSHSTGTTFDEKDYTFLSASEANTDSELA